MIDKVRNILRESASVRSALSACERLPEGGQFALRGVAGSMDAIIASLLLESLDRQILYSSSDREGAVRVADDLGLLLDPDKVFLYRSMGRAEHAHEQIDQKVGDIDALRAMSSGEAKIIVTEPRALLNRLPRPSALKDALLVIQTGDELPYDDLIRQLRASGFELCDFIDEIGSYAVRGGIVDVYPFTGENPVRIEFMGDRVESLREFDRLSQRSIRELSAATIVPDLLARNAGGERSTFLFDYLRDDALILLDEPDLQFKEMEDVLRSDNRATIKVEDVRSNLARFRTVIMSDHHSPTESVDISALPQPAFNGSIRFLRERIGRLLDEGTEVFVACEGQAELARLKDLIRGTEPETESGKHYLDRVQFVHHSLHEGFIAHDASVAFLTEHQLFQRRKKKGKGRRSYVPRGLSMRELQKLRRHDFVVHADHGIGRYEGLTRVSLKGVGHEVMKVVYEGNDVLYVNLNYVNRVQKYSSKEGHVPKLNRLGTGEWQKLKSRAKKKIKDIARDLIRLYAERKNAVGVAFQEDSPWQKELEASFVFEDTFDQAKATREVKADMETPSPMDRLICGDVGFGKTEVAVRAAFKAVLSGKQVAVLVPTTILALQHLNTFIDRLSLYSVQVRALSRLKSTAEQKQILEDLRRGRIDIVIGTHRLLSADVGFKDLGLLIVDEEHRFGVSAKEKLRQKKANVDTLTLTATPIPRTLHFSLMGARDLSVMGTPPRNRLPIETDIITYDEDRIRDTILREIHRGGQVYAVHDRVKDIDGFTARVAEIVPGIRIAHAHGQMHARELENVMLDFLERRLDVLVCTKIIESGLDIPNVNTIIINRADRFGMAELYQLRGRVGRSNMQAFALLIVPPISSLPKETLRRLEAMREFTELGAGFNLAMRDLEIRGAGNILGGEQSGFIANMGFETYSRTLEEAVNELKEQEFQDLFTAPKRTQLDETVVESDVETLIPSDYVTNHQERLEIYRKLYGVTSRAQVLEIGEEMRDRFGVLPKAAESLLEVLMIRLEAAQIGFRKVRITQTALEITAPNDPGVWDEAKTNSFVLGIAGIRQRSVSVRESNGELIVRAELNSGKGTLADAVEAFRLIAGTTPNGPQSPATQTT